MRLARLAIAIATVWGVYAPHSAYGAMAPERAVPEIMGGLPWQVELADGVAATFEGRTLGDIANSIGTQRASLSKRCAASWLMCYVLRPYHTVTWSKGAF